MNYQINNEKSESLIGTKGIEYFEKKYNATYVTDTCIKNGDGSWMNQPSAIFYQKTLPQPDYSHYFAVLVRNGQTYITSGQSAVDENITGIVADNGEVIFSRYRWDNRTSKDQSVTIDGGRDYVKCNDPSRLIEIKFHEDQMVLIQTIKKENTLTPSTESKKNNKLKF